MQWNKYIEDLEDYSSQIEAIRGAENKPEYKAGLRPRFGELEARDKY